MGDDRDVVGRRAQESRRSCAGDVADALLDLVVEPDRAAAGDLAAEQLGRMPHRQRLEPVRARVQIDDLLQDRKVAPRRKGCATAHDSGALTSSLSTSGRW